MKITLTGSLGNITKPLATALINAGHQVTIVSSNADRAPAIEALGATPAIGLVTDISFLAQAFTGADIVYLMVPPNLSASNMRTYIASIGQNYAAALQQTGIKRAVYLSSMGAHLPAGTGPITGAHDAEQLFNQLADIDMVYVRPPFFYVNFLNNIDMIKRAGILGSNYPANARLIMVHPKDIAMAIAEEIQRPFSGKSIRYIAGDEHTTQQAATILGTAIGKPQLPWIEFTDEQAYEGMLQGGLPEPVAKAFIEMGTAVRAGIIWTDFDASQTGITGKIKLEEFTAEFAKAFGLGN